MATTRNLASEERDISKKLFWGQFCALIHNDRASCMLGLEDALWTSHSCLTWRNSRCSGAGATIHRMTTDPLPSSKMKLYNVRKQKQNGGHLCASRWIDYHNKWQTDSRQTMSFGSFSDDSEKASQTDVKTDASSCTFPDNKKQPTCFAIAESPPTEQEFMIVFTLLKSLEASFLRMENQQVVKTHDKQIDIFEKQFKVSVVGLLYIDNIQPSYFLPKKHFFKVSKVWGPWDIFYAFVFFVSFAQKGCIIWLKIQYEL